MKLNLVFAMVFALGIQLTVGCSRSGGGGKTDPPGNDFKEYKTPQNYGLVTGIIKGSNGAPMGDVEVGIGTIKAASNNQGYFSISQLPENPQLVLNFTKMGYVNQTKVVYTRIGESNFIEVVMMPLGKTHKFNGTTGATIQSDNAKIFIPPRSLVTPDGRVYEGEVVMSVTVFDPSTDIGMKAFPGRFEGVQANGEKIPIRSLAFMDLTPKTKEGIKLQLAPNTEADVEMPIGPALLNSAPSELPLWYFNEQTGQWLEEGTAVKSGNSYRGKVKHFSIWNCDVGLRRAYVIGRVINCSDEGKPVKGARVTIQNVRAGWSSGEDSTPENGTFKIPVNADEPVNLWAEKNSAKSTVKSFTAPGRDQIYDVGDICLGTPKVQIVLTWGIKPTDLDAHLTIPTAQKRSHVFFSSKKAGDAQLDTDDTTSFGPEIITVFKLHEGVYRYSVHHFNGEGDISNSKAHVHMTVEGVGIFQMDPPQGAKGKGDLWVLWDFEVKNGRMVNLVPKSSLVEAKDVGPKKAIDP